jgi:hypothetical protein
MDSRKAEYGTEYTGQEDSRISNRIYWTGGQQNIEQEGSRILDTRIK